MLQMGKLKIMPKCSKWEFPFLPSPNPPPSLNLLDELFNDDTLVFQGQFNRVELISKLGFVMRIPCRTVWSLKVETFDQKWPQNGIILAYKRYFWPKPHIYMLI